MQPPCLGGGDGVCAVDMNHRRHPGSCGDLPFSPEERLISVRLNPLVGPPPEIMVRGNIFHRHGLEGRRIISAAVLTLLQSGRGSRAQDQDRASRGFLSVHRCIYRKRVISPIQKFPGAPGELALRALALEPGNRAGHLRLAF